MVGLHKNAFSGPAAIMHDPDAKQTNLALVYYDVKYGIVWVIYTILIRCWSWDQRAITKIQNNCMVKKLLCENNKLKVVSSLGQNVNICDNINYLNKVIV